MGVSIASRSRSATHPRPRAAPLATAPARHVPAWYRWPCNYAFRAIPQNAESSACGAFCEYRHGDSKTVGAIFWSPVFLRYRRLRRCEPLSSAGSRGLIAAPLQRGLCQIALGTTCGFGCDAIRIILWEDLDDVTHLHA